VELRRLEISNRLALNLEQRAQLGQFFTPSSIACFMAAMIEGRRRATIRILDAGGGNGILTAAAVAELCSRASRPSSIVASVWEMDLELVDDLHATIELCKAVCDKAGVAFEADLHVANFINDAVERLSGGDLFAQSSERYDLAILNPPYRKLRGDSDERSLLSSVGIEASNLYAAFTWLAIELLADGGEIVAITPRSYMNGTYFRPFRRRFVETMAFRHIHVYESRSTAFSEDDVLQENAIIHAVKGGRSKPVRITTSEGPDDSGLAERSLPPDRLFLPDDPHVVLHVVPDETDARISDAMRALPNTLGDLGVTVSTGRVVDFRARSRLRSEPQPGDAPLIFPRHIAHGFVAWPAEGKSKPNAITPEAPDDPLLMPSGWYVLIKRFSAKEERRRVVAALFDPRVIEADRIGFDNKLNVLHIRNGGMPALLAKGIAIFLNSTFVDAYFRQFSGHTQVNAGDLRSIRFPDAKVLERLGAHVNGRMLSQEAINKLIREEILSMSEGDDPVAAKEKVADGLAILNAIKAPKAQQNERSVLTLLGLLDLKADDAWSDVAAPLRGVTELMDWMALHYGKKYAPNTRETIRRYTLHQFIEMGLVLLNPDKPDRPPNSPKNVYQVEPSALALLKSYRTDDWGKNLSDYLRSMEGKNRLRVRARQIERIPVTLPEGVTIELSAGGQNVLIKEIIEQFAPRFTPGARVVYVGDAGEKHLVNDSEYLRNIGVEIDRHGKMPDVVIHYVDRDWLVLVEAVTSHGPVNVLRHNQLKALFAGSHCGLVFVTAFLDRRAMREYLPEIAWETEVWVADAPGHLIHFNGERFLGPYELSE
jgi:adenine-specific DNA-methyltransferase